MILYCFRCRAPHNGVTKQDFPEVCPECKRETHWTQTPESNDNAPYNFNQQKNTETIAKTRTLNVPSAKLEDYI